MTQETRYYCDKYIVGKVYEITPYIQILWAGMPPIGTYYAKFIGFNSKNNPVFEKDGRYFDMGEDSAKITEIMPERGE